MPQLIRLYLHSIAVGFALAALFACGLIWLDVAGVGRLILSSRAGWLAALMLLVSLGVIFSAVQFAFRIATLTEPNGTDPDRTDPKSKDPANRACPQPRR